MYSYLVEDKYNTKVIGYENITSQLVNHMMISPYFYECRGFYVLLLKIDKLYNESKFIFHKFSEEDMEIVLEGYPDNWIKKINFYIRKSNEQKNKIID